MYEVLRTRTLLGVSPYGVEYKYGVLRTKYEVLPLEDTFLIHLVIAPCSQKLISICSN